jgi:site-specific DNA recombinase
MKNRYLPFGYKIADGKIVADSEQVEAVRRIFDAYTAGQTFQQIADALSAQGIPYRSDASRWNKNMVSRILANADYCGTAEYPQIITAGQLEAAEQIRKSKTVTYSATLKPFRKDMQCGCCGARLYWHSKSNQWFCRECGMWSKPTQAKETFNSIVEKLRGLQQNSELIHNPEGQANVQSVEVTLLDREIWQALTNAEPDVDALVAKILHRAELEYEFCSAGDADPATMQIRKACAEYDLTDGFPYTFYKEVVSKVILYRDTHIEVRLQNGQIV